MARVAKTTRKRPVRSSQARRDILSVEGKDSGFEYRIVNDTPGRVADMKARGYEIAEGEEEFSSTLDDSTAVGSVKQKHVGAGTKAVLMRIPKEFYVEDQKMKEEHIDRLEQKTKTNTIKDGYGKVNIER